MSTTKTDSPTKPAAAEDKDDAAAERFVRDLAVRGEAATPTSAGKLPPDATHAVVAENEDGTVKEVKRARFKAF